MSRYIEPTKPPNPPGPVWDLVRIIAGSAVFLFAWALAMPFFVKALSLLDGYWKWMNEILGN